MRDLTAATRNWHYDYDDSGRVSTARDPLLRQVGYRYDAVGRVLRQTLPGGRVVGYGYDRDGRMTSLSPPGRPAHRFHYTATGLNDRYVPPGGGDSTVYAYNYDGQLEAVTRPGGEQVQLQYDGPSGRLDRIVEPRGEHVFDYWGASQGGLLHTVSSPDSIFCDYGYDGPLLTSEAWRGRVVGSVTHGYDNAFRPKTESVNGGSTVTYGYDADGVLSSAAGTWGTMTLGRDPASGLLSGTSIGTVSSTLGYNAHGELTDLDWTKGGLPYYHEHLVRDDLGRITQIDETLAGVSTSRTYGYDAAGRLTSVSEAGNPGASRGWEYDDNQPGNGNRTRATYGPGVPADTALYDVQDRLLSYGVSEYDWTAAGELLHRNRPGESLSTTYDVLGNLVGAALTGQVSGSQGLEPPPSTLVSYRVDGQNRRVERKVGGAGSPRTQRWLYRDGLAVVAELDSTNALVNRYVYGTQDHVPDLLVRADGTYRVITDHLGSIRALVNIATGAVAQRIDYDAWGNETANTAPTLQALGYAGGLTDPETHFIRFGARDYDPGVGRWTAKDPVGFEAGLCAYEYVRHDPLRNPDPSGLAPEFPKGKCVGKNIRVLQTLGKAGATTGVRGVEYLVWVGAVAPGGVWDYKKQFGIRYEDAGNYNYGATGAYLGIPLPILLRVGGPLQMLGAFRQAGFEGVLRRGSGYDPRCGTPLNPGDFGSFGDDPRDQDMIRQGYEAGGAQEGATGACGCEGSK